MATSVCARTLAVDLLAPVRLDTSTRPMTGGRVSVSHNLRPTEQFGA